jgi:putative transposase
MMDISTFSDEAWQEAKRRAEVTRPLAAREHCPRPLARAAAQDLGLSERQVYTLVLFAEMLAA